MPALSVGNLTVGGTGKTPVAAWLARRLAKAGARPAILMRGYGGDEPLVHTLLNPDIPVFADPDRVRGAAKARLEGANIVVLDDGFQHRKVERDVDVVLLSADRWTGVTPRLIPAGPFREPLSALRRASLVLITAKSATEAQIDGIAAAAKDAAPAVPQGLARISPRDLVEVGSGARRPLTALAGASVLLIAAVGDPGALVRQLEGLGARVDARIFRDHRRFGQRETELLARDAASADLALCTLKDAVKLGAFWPSGKPALWYVSQEVILDRGQAELDRLIVDLLERTAAASLKTG
jgi:tetraacyldisaccharide 4'-kinase